MNEHGDLSTKINSLASELRELTEQELELVQHTLDAIRKTRSEHLHFLGNMLGIELPDRDAEIPEAKLHLGLHNKNYFGVTQGGALYTFADITIGFIIMSRLETSKRVATLELKMNYLKPGTGNVLRCVPTILHWGKRTIVAECKIANDQGDLVATALGTFYYE